MVTRLEEALMTIRDRRGPVRTKPVSGGGRTNPRPEGSYPETLGVCCPAANAGRGQSGGRVALQFDLDILFRAEASVVLLQHLGDFGAAEFDRQVLAFG